MDKHSIKLVPIMSTNENITLSKCTYYNYGIEYGKCSGILNKIEAYYVYVDDKNTSIKLLVYPVYVEITSSHDIQPEDLYISSSATIFTIEVDYVANLDKAVFTLVNEYNDTNKVNLTKCSNVEKKKFSNKEQNYYFITCEGTIENAGKYKVYINGTKQSEGFTASSLSLSKALYVDPKVIKFEPDIESYIEIYFDSSKNFTSKNIALKGINEATIRLDYKSENSVRYKATFPAVDTYYVYIDGVKQKASILVTNEEFTSKVTAISPNLVPLEKRSSFTLTVDTNLGVEEADLILKKKDDNYNIYNSLSCKADSLEKTKAICLCSFGVEVDYEGEYYVSFRDGTEFKDVTVTAKNIPSLNSVSPISISPSSKEQTINLFFIDNVLSFADKVKFIVGTENIETKCTADSSVLLNCSAVFNKEDDYYITIDGFNIGKFINVNEKNNINEEEEKNKAKNSVNYLKISSLLLTLLLLLF